MEEQGLVIFPNGEIVTYGKYYSPDEDEYLNSPDHETNFKKEIVESLTFKLNDFTYDNNTSLYNNALKISLEGLLFVFNNQQKKLGPTEILTYLPQHPTLEQLTSLMESNLESIEVKKLVEFNSPDWDDYIEYDSFQDYINVKKIENEKTNQK